MKIHFKYIGIIAASTILILVVIVHFSKASIKRGGFYRIIRADIIDDGKMYVSHNLLSEVAGITKNHVYISTRDPLLLALFHLDSGYLSYISLRFPVIPKIGSLFWTFVDSPQVRILAGNARCIYSGYLNTNPFRWDSVYGNGFSLVSPISKNSFLLRGPDSNYNDQFLIKYDLITRKTIYENGLIDKRNDGGISTDGTFAFDSLTNWFIYSSFYRNTIVCFDSNLNRTAVFHTIDTCKNYQVSGLLQNDARGKSSYTVKGVPQFVNQACDACRGRLYIHSDQWAENESWSDHQSQSVIDIYDLTHQKYVFSFYIPDFDGKHMQTFKVLGNSILALYENATILFSLRHPVLFYQ